MENSAGKPVGAVISKKARLLDLQTLYKSECSKEGHHTEKNISNGDDEIKKKKSRKEVALSGFELVGKKSKRPFDEDHPEGFNSCSNDAGQGHLGLSQNSNSSNGANSISFSLHGNSNGGVIRVPKRPRGSVRHKKTETNKVTKLPRPTSSVDKVTRSKSEQKKQHGNHVLNTSGFPGSSPGSSEPKNKLTGNSLCNVVPSIIKQERDDIKEKTYRVNSDQNAKEEDGHLSSVNNGKVSSRKHHKNHKKNMVFGSGSKSVAGRVEPSPDTSSRIRGNFEDDDDEENLEQNAARMLLSRFDPSCTGFSTKSKPLQSPSSNSLSFLIPFRDFDSGEKNHIGGTDLASADNVSRVLRPRKQHIGKGISRKRRHFYEILPRDLDAYWVLNRCVKVFWPLDESWYYGLVDNYDPEKNLHHIKYDDRDEEWINLHNERFKLLLLPSEVPGNAKSKISDTGDTNFEKCKNNFSTEEDSYLGSYMDSEPIISWLARSSRRVKYSSSSALKKQKLVHLSSEFQQPLSGKSDDEHEEEGFLERDLTEFSKSVLPDRSAISSSDEKSVAEVSTSSKDSKCHIAYFRRRCHKKCVNKNKGGSLPGLNSVLVPVIHTFQPVKKSNFFPEHMGSAGLFWVTDDASFLKFSSPLVECKQYKIELCLPLPSVTLCTSGSENGWLLYTLNLLRPGTMVTVWPHVHLEMLFVDNIVGLIYLSFEGYLNQAVAFIFLILTLFYQPNEQGNCIDLEMPVTSIRFKLSHVLDRRKHHVFEFYSFCRLKNSLWCYLDSKFRQYCLLNKQPPLSESTYDKIKTLEGGSSQLQVGFVTGNSFSMEDLQKKSVQDITTLGVAKESYNVNSNWLLYDPNAKHDKLPPFALSFAAASTFFLSLHLQILMEHNIACMTLQNNNSLYLLGCPEKACTSTSDDCSDTEDNNAPQSTADSNMANYLMEAARTGFPFCSGPHMDADTFFASSGSCNAKLSAGIEGSNLVIALPSACSKELGNNSVDVVVQSHKSECSDPVSVQSSTSQELLVPKSHSSPSTSHSRWNPSLNGMNVEIPSFDQREKLLSGGSFRTYRACDSPWNLNDGFSHSPIPTGPRSLWQHSRNSSSSLFGDVSPVCSDGKLNFITNGFSNGPKKPRTQVHYTLPYEGLYFGSKHRVHSEKVIPFKRIRRANKKRISDGSRTSQKNLELLACDANVLMTHVDRGWREYEARIVLERTDQNEWRLAVKLSGMTKYSYKVHHVLQLGSTNRYTHATMWKGGKDWVLEFPDKNQWMLFKEMHEECYNRNIRAASVRNIPIPGVRLIEECDDSATEVLFVSGSPKYFRQVETDVDMAMDPSRILYDMDSDDEQWLSRNRDISGICENNCKEISEGLFERVMDTFEKVAYAQHHDYFASNEIEELMVGVGPMEVIKIIYEYWQQKREKKGMPLIRHLQPPLWESYQQQVKEWEQAVAKFGGGQGKALPLERPPMFAFCLKPRGLEVPNKGSKQRSQKRFHVSGHCPSVPGDYDGVHAFGRRSNGFAYGDEKVIFSGVGHERADVSPVLQASTRAFLQLDAGGSGYSSLNHDMSEWNHCPKLYRSKSKKIATFSSPGSPQKLSSYNQRTTAKRNGVNRCIMGLPEHLSPRHYQVELSHRNGIEQLDDSDLEEFRLRDASGVARHALNVAKVKRERAQKLLCRADEAIHKAVVALMTAEAVKASFEDSNDDG